MKRSLKSLIAYFSITLSWSIIILLILMVFEIIKVDPIIGILLLIPNIIFVNIYNKYKPITFRELFFKYTSVKLPTWKSISYRLQTLIGTDSDILKRESSNSGDKENSDVSQSDKTKTYKDYKENKSVR